MNFFLFWNLLKKFQAIDCMIITLKYCTIIDQYFNKLRNTSGLTILIEWATESSISFKNVFC